MAIIYHVTTSDEWKQALRAAEYSAPSLATEGFIHCSLDHQVAGVLERYFKNKSGLLKLVIDTGKLRNKYVLEWSASTNEEFPHIYGTINTDAVIDVIPL
jgi:uncharacterized protein (DUF952 family)